jgi:hypothetical protein
LGDGRVLYVWTYGRSNNVIPDLVNQGYAPSVASFISSNNSVTFDKTLITSGSTQSNRQCRATVFYGPDGGLYLSVTSYGNANSYHANFDPIPGGGWGSHIYESVDDGVSWQHVVELPWINDIPGDGYRFGEECTPGDIYDAGGGRWIHVSGDQENYLTAARAATSVFTSDSGISGPWIRRHTRGHVYGGIIHRQVTRFTDGRVYLHHKGSGVVGVVSHLESSGDNGNTWTVDDTMSPAVPNPPMFDGGPWHTDMGTTEHFVVAQARGFSAEGPGRLFVSNVSQPTGADFTQIRDWSFTTNGPPIVQILGSHAVIMIANQVLAMEISASVPGVSHFVTCAVAPCP